MKRIALFAAIVVALLCPALAGAQIYDDTEFDFRGRVSADIDKRIVDGLHAHAGAEFRVMDNFTAVDRIYLNAGLTYKVCPYFRLGVGYTMMNLHRYDEGDASWEWNIRHRAYLDLTGSYKSGNWKFSLRERFQLTHRTGQMNIYQNPRNEMVLRSRAKVEYSFNTAPVTPYLSVELRNTLNAVRFSSPSYTSEIGDNVSYNDAYINRVRVQPGVVWRLTRRSSLDFFLLGDYCYEKDYDANKEGKLKTEIIDGVELYSLHYQKAFHLSVGVGYSFSF